MYFAIYDLILNLNSFAYSDRDISELVAGLYIDDLADFLEEMPASVKRVLTTQRLTAIQCQSYFKIP